MTSVKTRVIGIGSPHGDDQVGWLFIERLGELRGLRADAVAVAYPCLILDHLDQCDRLVLVDACVAGELPGTVIRLEWPGVRLSRSAGRSSHGLTLGEVLELARKLGRLPRKVVLFVVEAAQTGVGSCTSQAALNAVEELMERVLEEVSGPLPVD